MIQKRYELNIYIFDIPDMKNINQSNKVSFKLQNVQEKFLGETKKDTMNPTEKAKFHECNVVGLTQHMHLTVQTTEDLWHMHFTACVDRTWKVPGFH